MGANAQTEKLWTENNRGTLTVSQAFCSQNSLLKSHPKLPASPDPTHSQCFPSSKYLPSPTKVKASPQMQMDITDPPSGSQPPAHLHSSHCSLFPSTASLAISTNKIKQGESCRDKKEQRDYKVVLAEERRRARTASIFLASPCWPAPRPSLPPSKWFHSAPQRQHSAWAKDSSHCPLRAYMSGAERNAEPVF